jgi:RecA/RadA recombinase
MTRSKSAGTRKKAASKKVPAKTRSSSRSSATTRKKAPAKKAPAKSTRAKAEVEEIAFNPYEKIDDAIDAIEKDFSLTNTGMDKTEKRMSTGLLSVDLVLGSGVVGGGWYTMFGPEQSCKSTAAVSLMTAALNTDVPILSYWDYEGSVDASYLESIMRNNGIKTPVEKVFGIRNEETHQWVVKPRVRYYSETLAEKFFDYLARLLRELPDKIKMGDDWYYVYPHTKPNKIKFAGMYDTTYFKQTNKFRIPAKDGNMQALVIVDSYPAMLPEGQDDDDPSKAMALQARMFSEQLKRVKGRLRAKRIAVVGVNQLRLRPAVLFGSPEYEPGGEALKFFSDVRLKWTPRALSSVISGGKGMIMEEESVTHHGKDQYRFVHCRAHKNKLSTPYLETMVRLWIEDATGKARGFDLVWDTWEYLKITGQLTGTRNNIRINAFGLEGVKLKWFDFKSLCLLVGKDLKAACDELGLDRSINLRKLCEKQCSTKGVELRNQHKQESLKSKDGDDEDEEY